MKVKSEANKPKYFQDQRDVKEEIKLFAQLAEGRTVFSTKEADKLNKELLESVTTKLPIILSSAKNISNIKSIADKFETKIKSKSRNESVMDTKKSNGIMYLENKLSEIRQTTIKTEEITTTYIETILKNISHTLMRLTPLYAAKLVHYNRHIKKSSTSQKKGGLFTSSKLTDEDFCFILKEQIKTVSKASESISKHLKALANFKQFQTLLSFFLNSGFYMGHPFISAVKAIKEELRPFFIRIHFKDFRVDYFDILHMANKMLFSYIELYKACRYYVPILKIHDDISGIITKNIYLTLINKISPGTIPIQKLKSFIEEDHAFWEILKEHPELVRNNEILIEPNQPKLIRFIDEKFKNSERVKRELKQLVLDITVRVLSIKKIKTNKAAVSLKEGLLKQSLLTFLIYKDLTHEKIYKITRYINSSHIAIREFRIALEGFIKKGVDAKTTSKRILRVKQLSNNAARTVKNIVNSDSEIPSYLKDDEILDTSLPGKPSHAELKKDLEKQSIISLYQIVANELSKYLKINFIPTPTSELIQIYIAKFAKDYKNVFTINHYRLMSKHPELTSNRRDLAIYYDNILELLNADRDTSDNKGFGDIIKFMRPEDFEFFIYLTQYLPKEANGLDPDIADDVTELLTAFTKHIEFQSRLPARSNDININNLYKKIAQVYTLKLSQKYEDAPNMLLHIKKRIEEDASLTKSFQIQERQNWNNEIDTLLSSWKKEVIKSIVPICLNQAKKYTLNKEYKTFKDDEVENLKRYFNDTHLSEFHNFLVVVNEVFKYNFPNKPFPNIGEEPLINYLAKNLLRKHNKMTSIYALINDRYDHLKHESNYNLEFKG